MIYQERIKDFRRGELWVYSNSTSTVNSTKMLNDTFPCRRVTFTPHEI